MSGESHNHISPNFTVEVSQFSESGYRIVETVVQDKITSILFEII